MYLFREIFVALLSLAYIYFCVVIYKHLRVPILPYIVDIFFHNSVVQNSY